MVRALSGDEQEDIKPDWLDELFKEHSSYEVGVANSYELDEHELKQAIKQKILNAIGERETVIVKAREKYLLNQIDVAKFARNELREEIIEELGLGEEN